MKGVKRSGGERGSVSVLLALSLGAFTVVAGAVLVLAAGVLAGQGAQAKADLAAITAAQVAVASRQVGETSGEASGPCAAAGAVASVNGGKLSECVALAPGVYRVTFEGQKIRWVKVVKVSVAGPVSRLE